jgi:hypothetical protein
MRAGVSKKRNLILAVFFVTKLVKDLARIAWPISRTYVGIVTDGSGKGKITATLMGISKPSDNKHRNLTLMNHLCAAWLQVRRNGSRRIIMKTPRKFSMQICHFLATGASMLFFSVSSLGQGTINITFDGPPPQPVGTSYGYSKYIEAGVSFTPIDPNAPFAQFGRRRGGGTPPPYWPDNGTAYLQTGIADSVKFSFLNNSFFGVSSVDLAGFSDVEPDFSVQFVGYRPDGSTVINDFSGNGLDFKTFYFGPEFTGLSRVEISTIGWSLDNLVVSIPEPSVSALLVFGCILGLPFLVRKRR